MANKCANWLLARQTLYVANGTICLFPCRVRPSQATSMTPLCPRAHSRPPLLPARCTLTTHAGMECPSCSRLARHCTSAVLRSGCNSGRYIVLGDGGHRLWGGAEQPIEVSSGGHLPSLRGQRCLLTSVSICLLRLLQWLHGHELRKYVISL